MTNRAFLEAIAEACGLDLGRIKKLTIDFTAPHEFGDVTVQTYVGEGLDAVVKRFRLHAVAAPAADSSAGHGAHEL